MLSPLRFLRRLLALPGNVERTSQYAEHVHELSSQINILQGELRALRIQADDLQHDRRADIQMSEVKILDKMTEQLNELELIRADTSIFDRLGPVSDALQDMRVTAGHLKPIRDKLNPMDDALQDMRTRMNRLDRIDDLLCDIKNVAEDLRRGAFELPVVRHREELIRNHAHAKNAAWLGRHEYQAFSQNGEDGIIAEIFKRIGTTTKKFVECGVSDGLECNTTALLLQGWTGYWVEQDATFLKTIAEKFAPHVANKSLTVVPTFLTAENVQSTLQKAAVPEEFDFLSIDVDGNDYWLWKALDKYKPRVVCIEYNAVYRPGMEWIVAYDPHFRWTGSRYYGAALESLVKLAEAKGYVLVGCELTGNNAFFVRKHAAGHAFLAPHTAAMHYEPPRYYLVHSEGHKRDMGPFVR